MTLLGIILNTSFSVVAIGLTVWFAREWISARLKAVIQHEHDIKLETYKSQLKTESEKSILEFQTDIKQKLSLYEAARASIMVGQKSSIERKLNSIERLWDEILRLKNECPAILGLLNVLTVEECAQMYARGEYKELARENSLDNINKYIGIKEFNVEKSRPYIGEYLWSLFFAYRQIMGRILYLVYTGVEDENKAQWDKDKGIRQILNAVLNQDEINEFDEVKFGKVVLLQRKLEAKILKASQKIISGEEFGAESLKHAELILEQITKVEIFEGKNDVS